MRNNIVISLGLIASLAALNSVQADEVWDSNSGRIVYEAEMGPTAVWSYGNQQEPGVIYVLGLAKVYSNRTSYPGYWAKNTSKKACDTQRPGINGQMTAYWGRFNVRFLDKNFPSRWEATWSYCDEPDEALKVQAKPVVGTPNQPNNLQTKPAPAVK